MKDILQYCTDHPIISIFVFVLCMQFVGKTMERCAHWLAVFLHGWPPTPVEEKEDEEDEDEDEPYADDADVAGAKHDDQSQARHRYEWMDVLGLKIGCTYKDAKSSYRKMVQKHHPDKGGNAENFRKVNSAFKQAQQFFGAHA